MSVCLLCGVDNEPGVRFCKGCGDPLVDTDLLSAGIVCPTCDTYNVPSLRTCSNCGANLSGVTGFLHSIDTGPNLPLGSGQAAIEQTEKALHEAGERAGEKKSVRALGTPQSVPISPIGEPAQKPRASQPNQPDRLIGTPPASRADLAQPNPLLARRPEPGDGAEPVRVQVASAPVLAQDVSVRLLFVRGHMHAGSRFPVGPQATIIGRRAATIVIGDDPYLSPRHVRLELVRGRLICTDLESLNGTFVRVRGTVHLRPGAEFLAGSQRFRLIGFGGPTTDVSVGNAMDTRPLGGPIPGQLFVALRLIHVDRSHQPIAGPVILQSGPTITVGTEGADLNFPGDPAMAPRQFELQVRAQSLALAVDATSTGVFLRITEPTPLGHGDEFQVGTEAFRVEIG